MFVGCSDHMLIAEKVGMCYFSFLSFCRFYTPNNFLATKAILEHVVLCDMKVNKKVLEHILIHCIKCRFIKTLLYIV